MRTPVYVGLAIASIAFGVLGMFTIGLPFVVTGVAMLAVMSWRHRRDVLWPALAAPWGFTLTYVLLAPLSCTSSGPIGPLLARTECSNVLGIDYGGTGAYRPPLMPAIIAGLLAAVLIAFVLHRVLARRAADA